MLNPHYSPAAEHFLKSLDETNMDLASSAQDASGTHGSFFWAQKLQCYPDERDGWGTHSLTWDYQHGPQNACRCDIKSLGGISLLTGFEVSTAHSLPFECTGCSIHNVNETLVLTRRPSFSEWGDITTRLWYLFGVGSTSVPSSMMTSYHVTMCQMNQSEVALELLMAVWTLMQMTSHPGCHSGDKSW